MEGRKGERGGGKEREGGKLAAAAVPRAPLPYLLVLECEEDEHGVVSSRGPGDGQLAPELHVRHRLTTISSRRRGVGRE